MTHSKIAGQRFIVIDDELDFLIRMRALFMGYYGAAEVICICTAKPETPPNLDGSQFYRFPDRMVGGRVLLGYIEKQLLDITEHIPKAVILCNNLLDPSVFIEEGLHKHYQKAPSVLDGTPDADPNSVFISQIDMEDITSNHGHFGITGSYNVSALIKTHGIKNPFIIYTASPNPPATLERLEADGIVCETFTDLFGVCDQVQTAILKAIEAANSRIQVPQDPEDKWTAMLAETGNRTRTGPNP